MVGHTHQDFLQRVDVNAPVPEAVEHLDLSDLKDFREPLELFDYPTGYRRKINISYMDEHLDDIDDWKQFVDPLRGINRLYIVNDRSVSNPIMSAYAEELNHRYLSQLSTDGIHAIIVPGE